MSQASPSKQQFVIELLLRLTTDIFQFTAFEQIPHSFLGVEFGRIGRQAFQMDARSRSLSQKVFDRLRAMNASPIPNDEQLPPDLAQKVFEEANHIRALVRVQSGLHKEPPIGGNGSNR